MSDSATKGIEMNQPPAPSRMLTLPDRRVLAWDEHGDPDGPAVFHFHGTPVNRLEPEVVVRAAERTGVRLIAPDRPGCGDSTFDPNRTIGTWAADVAAIADELNIDRFTVIGSSGGGPYALACAALIPERVIEAYVVAGVGPLDTPEGRAAMNPINRGVFETAAQGRFAATSLADALAGKVDPSGEAGGTLQEMMAATPPADAAAMEADPTLMEWVARMAALSSVRDSTGPAYEMWLCTQPWDFDLGAIRVPVKIHAGAHDVNVPLAHLTFQHESIPGSTLTIWPNDGHLIGAVRIPDVFEEITRQVDGATPA